MRHSQPVAERPELDTVAHRAVDRPIVVGQRFLGALLQRDFDTLEALLDPDVWLRALLPRHLDERHGAAGVAGAFRSWYGAAEELVVVSHVHDMVADKERIGYRFRLRPDWAPEQWHVIEQTAFLSVREGRVRKIDLACSGFIAVSDASASR